MMTRQKLMGLIFAATFILPGAGSSLAQSAEGPCHVYRDTWITDVAEREQAEEIVGKAGVLVLHGKIMGTEGDPVPYKPSTQFLAKNDKETDKDKKLTTTEVDILKQMRGDEYQNLLGFQKRISELSTSPAEAKLLVEHVEKLFRPDEVHANGAIYGNGALVSNTEFTDADLLQILPALEIIDRTSPIVMLELRYTKVTGVGFAQIDGRLPHLRIVDLASTPLSDSGLHSLSTFCAGRANLTHLCLDATTLHFTYLQELLATFSSADKILGLSMEKVNVLDEHGKKIKADIWAGKLAALKLQLRFVHLDLANTDLTDDGLIEILKLFRRDSSLTSLQLANNSDITGGGLGNIEAKFVNCELVFLDLSGTKSKDEDLVALLKKVNGQLATLKISGTYAFGSHAQELIGVIKDFKKLDTLDISTTGLLDDYLLDLGERNQSVTNLNVSGTKVTNKGLLEDNWFSPRPVIFPNLTKIATTDTKITSGGLNSWNAIRRPALPLTKN